MSDQPIARYFLEIFRGFERRIISSLHASGFKDIKSSHLNVLRHLNPEGMRLTALARDAAMTKQAVAKTVNDLVAKRYLQTGNDVTDARAQIINYTARGKRMIEKSTDIVSSIEREYEKLLGEEGYPALRQFLVQLADHERKFATKEKIR